MSYLKQYVFLCNLILFFKNRSKYETARAKKLFRGEGLKGDIKKNDFPQIVISLKPFKTIFMT